jgi:hypothetical protein
MKKPMNRHHTKREIAKEVFAEVRRHNGRFLHKVESKLEAGIPEGLAVC